MASSKAPSQADGSAFEQINAQLDASLKELTANGASTAKADEFEAFLRSPDTLRRPSLIVRCRFDGRALDVRTVVDKPYSRRRVAEGLEPCLQRIREELVGPFDVLILVSDMVHVEDDALDRYVAFLRHVPFLRSDRLEGDRFSCNALLMPDPWLQEPAYAEEVATIDRAAKARPFADRDPVIKWRGGLSGPGYPDIDNCHDFARYKFLSVARLRPDIVDARLTHYENIPETPAGMALRRQLDSWFGGLAPIMPIEDFAAYKYLVSFDGVASSWKRVATILWTGSVLLMQHRWRQYFYPGLVAWRHFVPIADDASDLIERFEWLEANPDEASSIAHDGREFARTVLTPEAVDGYMGRLLNRCALLG